MESSIFTLTKLKIITKTNIQRNSPFFGTELGVSRYFKLFFLFSKAEGRAEENIMAKNRYHTTVIHHHPGGNLKGQTTQVKKYHTGKRSTSFIEDSKARAKSLYSRKQTILKKVSFIQ